MQVVLSHIFIQFMSNNYIQKNFNKQQKFRYFYKCSSLISAPLE